MGDKEKTKKKPKKKPVKKQVRGVGLPLPPPSTEIHTHGSPS
jgi:hypothetical protein